MIFISSETGAQYCTSFDFDERDDEEDEEDYFEDEELERDEDLDDDPLECCLSELFLFFFSSSFPLNFEVFFSVAAVLLLLYVLLLLTLPGLEI